MNYFITFILFALCFLGMGLGLIFAKKSLKKGCSLDPDSCACQKEGKDPSKCDR